MGNNNDKPKGFWENVAVKDRRIGIILFILFVVIKLAHWLYTKYF